MYTKATTNRSRMKYIGWYFLRVCLFRLSYARKLLCVIFIPAIAQKRNVDCISWCKENVVIIYEFWYRKHKFIWTVIIANFQIIFIILPRLRWWLIYDTNVISEKSLHDRKILFLKAVLRRSFILYMSICLPWVYYCSKR